MFCLATGYYLLITAVPNVTDDLKEDDGIETEEKKKKQGVRKRKRAAQKRGSKE